MAERRKESNTRPRTLKRCTNPNCHRALCIDPVWCEPARVVTFEELKRLNEKVRKP